MFQSISPALKIFHLKLIFSNIQLPNFKNTIFMKKSKLRLLILNFTQSDVWVFIGNDYQDFDHDKKFLQVFDIR